MTIDDAMKAATRTSVMFGAVAAVVVLAAWALRGFGPNLQEIVGVASTWRLWVVIGSGVPFLLASSLGSRIHGFREPLEERIPKILETHRQALMFALFSVLIGAVWVWSVGTPMQDDWLPVVIGGCAWLAQSLRAGFAIRRLRRHS